MAQDIKITPEELRSQAAQMRTLQDEFSSLFANVSSDLKKVNNNWSPNLSHNFEGKINSAQNSFTQITQELMNGANVADTCAVTFQSVDSQLAKLYCTDEPASSFWGDLWDNLKEDFESAGEGLAWLEKMYGKLPHELTHLINVLLPGSLKDAYKLTSGLLQGDLTWGDAWDVAKHILAKNTKLAIISETFDYTFKKGSEREDELMENSLNELKEGDILGLLFEGAEGFVDTILGGAVDVLGKVGGGLVDQYIKDLSDKIPYVDKVNDFAEYITGAMGLNDGEGYSAGGLITAGAEALSEGLDKATDYITTGTNYVTDTITDGVKSGIKWVASLFG